MHDPDIREETLVRIAVDGEYRGDGVSISGTVRHIDTDWLSNVATVVFATGPQQIALTFAPERFGASGSEPHPFEALLAMNEGDRFFLKTEVGCESILFRIETPASTGELR